MSKIDGKGGGVLKHRRAVFSSEPETFHNGQERWKVRDIGRSETFAKSRSRSRLKNERITREIKSKSFVFEAWTRTYRERGFDKRLFGPFIMLLSVSQHFMIDYDRFYFRRKWMIL